MVLLRSVGGGAAMRREGRRAMASPTVLSGGLSLLSVLLLLALTAGEARGQELRENDIVLARRGLDVPLGRSVYLTPDDLLLAVREGDRCTVTVLDNDPLSQRPGRLTPTRFPCNFGPREVQYSHFGSRRPSEDRVRLLVRYDSPTDTLLIPLSIHIKVSFEQLEIVTVNKPINVDELMGLSQPISAETLEFTFDRSTEQCKVTVLSAASGLPRYGLVTTDASQLQMVDCDVFLDKGVQYRHTAENNSPNRDYIPMVVELLDPTGKVVKQEYFQVTVRITQGIRNTRPQASFDALLVMEVDQFVMTAITPEILAAEDIETPADEIIFNLTIPMQPGEGYIVSTDDRSMPITSFYQKDIRDLKIAYKPPPEDSNVQRIFQVNLEAIDDEGAQSDPIMVMIVVKPMNTLAPVVTTNTGIQLFEGQSRPLKNLKNLGLSDENNLRDVQVTVLDGLRHGRLEIPDGRKFFTQSDLEQGAVVYQHDDSDSITDNIIFRMTDGENEVEFLFPVTIFPEDDEPPILNVNTVLEIRKGEIAEISAYTLSATDIDSDDSTIRFVLELPYSEEGVILKRQFQQPEDPENWLYNNGVYEKIVQEFTQQDILDGKIFYQHGGTHRSDFVLDKIRFKLLDDSEPPNESEVQEFVVKIAPVDDQPPYLYPNTPLEMTVNEFQITEFRRRFLRYTDDDTDDRDLVYRVIRPPFDTDSNTPLGAGDIVLCEEPETKATVFTQAQVNHLKVCYRPPSAELGLMPRIIQFTFSVEDTSGNVLPDQRFIVKLKPVDNKPPRITNGGVMVMENGFSVITPQMLDAVDPDTDDTNIKFMVMELPLHGSITLGEDELEVGDPFTRDDIERGRVRYINTGDEMDKDEFKIDVTDGIHHVPITFRIDVRSVDDEAPQLVGLDGTTLAIVLEVPENSAVTITSDHIKASDPDTDDMMLTFVLDKIPSEGVIFRGGQQTNRFTQEDIMTGLIQYQHTGGEVGLRGRNDSFSLILTDLSDNYIVGGNRITKIDILVKIQPVDSEPPVVTLGAPFEVAESQKAPILPAHLDATDPDTVDEDIICMIISQPTNGYVENISPGPGSEKPRTGIPVSAFTIGDIRLGLINYVQSVHQGVEPREDVFTFQCSDGINHSRNFAFQVAIFPTNDEQPDVFLREFMVLEGMNLMIDVPILNAVDNDEPEDVLTFHIIEPPKHGQIVQQKPQGTFPVSTFTHDDISKLSTIEYEHDDSETTKDEFTFFLTDGKHNLTRKVPIIVIPVDDETPRLTINNGLELERVGQLKTVTNEMLKAEDLDSNDPDLIFIVRRQPKFGYLQKVDEVGDTYNLTVGSNFTQRDIDTRRIQYLHTADEGGRDLVKLDVTDGLNPLIDRYFYVTVEGLDITFPQVINKGVELPEGGTVTLTTDLVSGSDLNSPDENLQFIITRAPSRGHLESTDMPGVPITTFSQLELAGNKVRYVHTAADEMKMDSFEFEVTDGINPVARTFRISLSDVDNKKPVVMFQTLRLKEGDNKLITPFELKAEDRDTEDDLVVFTVTQVPLHGNLLFNSTQIVVSFSMQDLHENLISYQHDGTETHSDSFSFTVTDGTHSDFYVFPETSITTRQPQRLPIEIVPVDNGIPQISINRGASYLSPIEGGGLGFRLSNRILATEDRDSPDDTLLYTLTSPPKHGYLINRYLGNHSVSNWTQGDINRNRIEYILRPGDNATSDSFFFKITDRGDNVLANQPFHLNWAWISAESDAIFVNETDETLVLTLRRRGYLGETSFVTIRAVNGTAKVGEDTYSRYASQVQFNPGETEKTWRLNLRDDTEYEERETFSLRLQEPVAAVLEYPDVVTVTIRDAEDESTAFITEGEYRVPENIGEVLIPVERTGDVMGELMVICSTVQGGGKDLASATGTIPSTVTSFSDYITRPADHRSVIRFDKGERQKFCRVMVIDDSLFEEEEDFMVVLSEPMGGKLGQFNATRVVIQPDKTDEPTFYFGRGEYLVDESEGFVEVKVWRTGTDLSQPSSITVRSRRTDPKSAEAGLDYIAVNRILDFAPGVTMQTVRITILDDLGRPRVEGNETFQVVLRMPMGASLGEPSTSVITITDALSDVPTMQFREPEYEVQENDGEVTALVYRSGDTSQLSRVRCYTRQDTAKVALDYVERPDTNASLLTFLPGEYEQKCVVRLVNDSIFEDEEQFRLVLGSPSTDTDMPATVGKANATLIKIKDHGDKPSIRLEQDKYIIKEPMFKEETTVLSVGVVREGDLTQTIVVTINTKDGSADAGKDYNGVFKELVFGANVSRQVVDIEILHDGEKEMREVFTIHLKLRSGDATVKTPKAMVYIEERIKVADVTFPSPPMVISLRDYDDAENAEQNPIQGYPVVCVTPCNPKHPNFQQTGGLCEREGINDTLTLFRWRVSAPTGIDGVTSDLSDVESNTFFASTKGITLDSIYFGAGSRVQCGARAVNSEGDPGLELVSQPVVVSRSEGICEPRDMDSVGAEPFTAKLRYIGAEDPEHPNKVRVSVIIPHRDGMMPVISTRQLSNFELTLSKDGTRLAAHRCSNLLDYNEVPTQFGFLTNQTKNPNIIGEAEPYQYSTRLRTDPTLRFYRNLNMDACLWEFVTYFDMSELVNECGGAINTDGQVLDLKQSYVAMRIPLYVSYVFHSPVATGGWLHYDMNTQLQLTFVYDTAILWQNGISSPEGENGLQGYMFPTSMRIRDDGRLAVSFRTEARFRGLFVHTHPGSSLESMVISPDNQDLTFSLSLVQSEPTYEQPEQMWEFVSDYAVRDYSGRYTIKLIPCTTAIDQEYSLPVNCNPRAPVTFDLPIRFQQVSDPVAERFSLNTQFHLMRKRELWTSDGSMGFGDGQDVSFAPGDKIYGRVDVDPVQKLGSSFKLNIEKVFLCSGKDGYIPKYDPDNREYGCIAESPTLEHAFKILDKGAPFTQMERFRDIPFNAQMASQDPGALDLVRQSGADGFSLDCQPLFQVDGGRQWFLHTIYTVRSEENAARGIGKRSVEYHSVEVFGRRRRAAEDLQGIGEQGRGTNIAVIALDYSSDTGVYEVGTTTSTTTNVPLLPILIALAILLIICVIIAVVFVRRRRKYSTPPPTPTKTITVVNGYGKSKIYHAPLEQDKTEV